MNSKFLLALCLIAFIAIAAAGPMMPVDSEADSDVPHDRVRRQWGYGMGYPMMGYGMGMYRPWGMGYGMYRPWGMMGMYG
uniref:Uncharacterized protein n=1 Tax=Panagrolaimus davidi TaxID=227884 RepID=A0A914PZT6_9BILA